MTIEPRPDGEIPNRPAAPSTIKTPRPASPPGQVVLFDGDCGMCHRAVAFILRHERHPTLGFSALGSPYAIAALAARGFAAPPPDTLIVIDGTDIRIRSDAVLIIAAHLRAPWRWLRIFSPTPKRLRDGAYDFVAKRRHGLFKKPASACPVPDAPVRKRFL